MQFSGQGTHSRSLAEGVYPIEQAVQVVGKVLAHKTHPMIIVPHEAQPVCATSTNYAMLGQVHRELEIAKGELQVRQLVEEVQLEQVVGQAKHVAVG